MNTGVTAINGERTATWKSIWYPLLQRNGNIMNIRDTTVISAWYATASIVPYRTLVTVYGPITSNEETANAILLNLFEEYDTLSG